MNTKTTLIQTLLLMAALIGTMRAGAQPVTAIAAGDYTSYFLRSDGTVLAAGNNSYGQLGNGTNGSGYGYYVNVPSPVLVSNVTAIAAGFNHALFLRKDGVMLGTGYNAYGQLGTGTNLNLNVPTPIASNVTSIAAGGGENSFYIDTNGNLYGAGLNEQGAVGNGSNSFVNPFQLILTGVKAVSEGYDNSIFLKTDGSLFASGANSHGQFGLGTGAANAGFSTNRPAKIKGAGVSAIASGVYFTMYITTDSNLWAMGDDSYGQLGDGLTSAYAFSAELIDSNVVSVAAGAYHTLYLKNDGSLWAMGYDNYGDLGNGKNTATNRAQLIVSSNVVAVAGELNSADSFFLKKDGSVWAMGANSDGEFGNGTYFGETNRPVQIIAGIPAGFGLLVTPVFNLGAFHFSFLGLSGTNYALDRTFQLFPPNWIAQSTNHAGSDGTVLFTNVVVANSNNFWRVREILK